MVCYIYVKRNKEIAWGHPKPRRVTDPKPLVNSLRSNNKNRVVQWEGVVINFLSAIARLRRLIHGTKPAHS